MILKLKRTPGIYIVGFTAAGKSTVGRYLAERLGWSFIDTDIEIARHVRTIESGHPAVVAIGSEAFTQPGSRQLLANNGITVWLDCPFETVERRVLHDPKRPLARDPERLLALFLMRRESYSLADVQIPILDEDAADVVRTIMAHPFLR